ncbi:MAG TPA: alpha/beta hydrolase [Candidatus Dormibacteraeota bacterium]|nr:alpha/beta hydrolase [Candidatus Dormibacteraeota bacterium]
MFGRSRSKSVRSTGRERPAFERLDLADLHFADEMPEGRSVDLPGRGSAFVRMASGPAGAPTVLLVHGLFATADLNWSTAIPELATRFNVIAPDLRGHGRGLPTRRFSGAECADDLAAIVRALEAGRVIVVGYSLGGLVAQVFARRHPELLAGLVLCATASRFRIPTEKGLVRFVMKAARRAPERVRRAAMITAMKPRSADCERGRWLMNQVRHHDTGALLDAVAELGGFDSGGWLGETDRPSAVIVMTQDTTVSAEAQHDLARALRRCSVHEVEGDHFVCVKRPSEFNAVLVDACAGVFAQVS